MRAVFDLDDTICTHSNRDYEHAKPVAGVVEKINKMKDDGWEIYIYTARGQVSCKGDIAKIEQKNRAVAEKWLADNNVKYDALIFGKPLGDLYVDDKAMSLDDFLRKPFYLLQGGSGKAVYRQGDIVRKDLGTAKECESFKRWMEANSGEFKYPRVTSFVYDTVYMEYIDGVRGCDIDAVFIPSLLQGVSKCKENARQPFDILPHIESLKLNYTSDSAANELLNDVAAYLKANESRLQRKGSFCHGDLTLSNTIVKDGEVYTVDARYVEGASSYLLDLAKLRMSVNGYENIFGISNVDNSKWCRDIDEVAETWGVLRDVHYLEIMHILRCYRYKDEVDKIKVIQFALREGERWL